MPTTGYYLYGWGKKIYARSQEQKQQFTEPEVATAQWKVELAFGAWCVLYAGFGLALLQVLKAVDNLQ